MRRAVTEAWLWAAVLALASGRIPSAVRSLLANQAIGGAGGAGANGGDALGGGLFNLGTAALTQSLIVGNTAIGGARRLWRAGRECPGRRRLQLG